MWAAPGSPPGEVIAILQERGAQLDDYARRYGRDPGEIQRSFLQGWTADTPWASPSAFEDFVGRYREAGISEFIFPYPPDLFAAFRDFPPGSVRPGVFDRAAVEIIPALRNQ